MKNEKRILYVVLFVIVYSMISHWSDVKKGFIDGVNDGAATAQSQSK